MFIGWELKNVILASLEARKLCTEHVRWFLRRQQTAVRSSFALLPYLCSLGMWEYCLEPQQPARTKKLYEE